MANIQANTLGDVNANLQNENSYDLVCLGVHNKSGTCYLSVFMQCILSMEATRRAFMNLPDPNSPLYCIPDDSMTALIHFFFLHRRRPKMSDYHRLRKPAIAEEHLIRIEIMVKREVYKVIERELSGFEKTMEKELSLDFEKMMDREFPQGFGKMMERELPRDFEKMMERGLPPGILKMMERELPPGFEKMMEGFEKMMEKELPPGFEKMMERELPPGLEKKMERELPSGFEKMIERELPPGFEKMMERELPPGFDKMTRKLIEKELQPGLEEGKGGDNVVVTLHYILMHLIREGGNVGFTLHYILMQLIQEGYVKGLEEDLSGKYTTRSHDNERITNHIMLTFFTNPGTLPEFVHKGEGGADNNTTIVFSIHHLFKFAQLYPHDPSKLSFWDFLHTKQFQTTVAHFLHTLIFDTGMIFQHCRVNIILDEFLDLSQLVESEATPTMKAKYKLAVVSEAVEKANTGFINHGISYVRASKYANDIYCDQQRSVDRENMWYKVDDIEVELIPFSSVCKITGHVLLIIYEREQPSTQNRKELEQQLSTYKKEQLSTQNRK